MYPIIHSFFLCERLGQYLQGGNTHMREAISNKTKSSMSVQRLGTRNTLYIVEKVYGIVESTKIVI